MSAPPWNLPFERQPGDLAAGRSRDGYRWRIWRGETSGRLLAAITPESGQRTVWGLTRKASLAEAVTEVQRNMDAHRATGVWP